ncbi:MAG: hypothetical protein QG656_2187, partial [Candidatus Hydrogenedentes bacterium]|nr:hypothetical protein [Candidatus Hydrogenedentota bacterium]
GALYVDTRGTVISFGQSDLELLVALAGPAAIAIRNAQHEHEREQYVKLLERSYDDTLIVLADAIELRDHYTVGHTWRVSNFAVEIARQMGWTEDRVKLAQMGGIVHDVGKIAIDNAILSKPGRLTPEEYEAMKVHPERGARIMEDVSFLKPVVPFCLYHHEWYDGRGYPCGLKGAAIPIEGRLMAVADTFDAMTSHRPHREGIEPELALKEIIDGKGTQFDPVCVDALVACYGDGKLDRILKGSPKDGHSIACPFCSTFIPIPEGVHASEMFHCEVCRRRVRLVRQEDAYAGELVSETE